jgi:uncharacterized membrane protein
VRRLTLAAAALLGACVAAATLRGAPWPANVGWTLLMLVPLLLPLPGLLRGTRRTFAWATLCVAPYFAYGLTEVVANPSARGVAAAILFASLAWFASLVYGLRVTRQARPPGQDASAD